MVRDYDKWAFCVVGPGGAIQLRNERLIAACCTQAPGWLSYVVYSDDNGKTWSRGEFFPERIGTNECQAAELADGRLLLDARQVSGPHRWQAISRDGGETWATHRPGVEVSPVCCAIERLSSEKDKGESVRILWVGPKGPGRNNLVARISCDGGETFGAELLVAEGPAAYSDMTLLANGDAGVLWERGGYKYITYTVVSPGLVPTPESQQ